MFVLLHAVELLHRPVDDQNPALGVLDHHRQGRVLDDHGGQGAASTGVVLSLHKVGHVAGDQQHAADAAVLLAPRAGVPAHPTGLAVRQGQELGLAAHVLAGQNPLVRGFEFLGVGGGLIGGHADPALAGEAEVGLPLRAGGHEAQIEIGHRHGQRRVLDEGLDRLELGGPTAELARLARGRHGLGRGPISPFPPPKAGARMVGRT